MSCYSSSSFHPLTNDSSHSLISFKKKSPLPLPSSPADHSNDTNPCHSHSHCHTLPACPSSSAPSICYSTCGSSSSPLPRRSFWNIRCRCIFSAVPDELLIFFVFKYFSHKELSSLARVSRRWRWMVGDPILYKNIDLSKNTHSIETINNDNSNNHRNRGIDDQSFHSLVHRFGRTMESLKLCHNHSLSLASLEKIPSTMISLRSLHLCGLSIINDTLVSSLLSSLPQLSILSLYHCNKITDAALIPLSHHKEIMELSLRCCPLLTDEALAYFPPQLQSVNLANNTKITNAGLKQLMKNCGKSIKHLNLHGLLLNDESIEIISSPSPSSMDTLHLSNPNPFGGGSRLTDHLFSSLSKLRSLRILNLQGASGITDNGIKLWTERGGSKKIEKLNLGGCYRLTDQSIIYLAKNTPHLLELSLFQCVNITDKSLMILALLAQKIKYLDLHSCAGITGASVAMMAMEDDDEDDDNDDGEEGEKEENDGEEGKEISKSIQSTDSESSSFSANNRRLSSSSSLSSLDDDDPINHHPSLSSLDPDDHSNHNYYQNDQKRNNDRIGEGALEKGPRYYFPCLQLLDIGSCRQINAADIQLLAEKRKNIKIRYH